jgi:hypothetical protein
VATLLTVIFFDVDGSNGEDDGRAFSTSRELVERVLERWHDFPVADVPRPLRTGRSPSSRRARNSFW